MLDGLIMLGGSFIDTTGELEGTTVTVTVAAELLRVESKTVTSITEVVSFDAKYTASEDVAVRLVVRVRPQRVDSTGRVVKQFQE